MEATETSWRFRVGGESGGNQESGRKRRFSGDAIKISQRCGDVVGLAVVREGNGEWGSGSG